MRVIVAGSRGATKDAVLEALRQASVYISVVICGGARGADQHGADLAREKGIPVEYYHADWDTYGKAAGYIRNRKMAEVADALIAVWDGQSRGTKNMIEEATKKGLPVFVWRY